MRVVVQTPDQRWPIRVPVPLGMVGTIVNFIPERLLVRAQESADPRFRGLLTKPVLKYLLGECVHVLKEYKGLEIVHVESAEGELVSITL